MQINNPEISVSPHIRSPYGVKSIMWGFFLALIFPVLAASYFFGLKALTLVIICGLSSIFAEAAYQFIAKRPITIFDGSAAITGVLLALNLPPSLPAWMAVIGSIFAIVVVKGFFGGLGFNIFNPALAARAFLLASWPVAMTTWSRPFDAVTTASPLFMAKMHQALPSYWDLFLGNHAGSLGETSVIALLIGAIILLLTKIIDWSVPVSYIGTVALLTYLLGHDPVFYVLSGGLILGAFYMATDYVTCPVTTKGRLVFGIGCGIMTVMMRFFGGFPEGVCYSILFMNILTPVIDRHARPRLYGKVKKSAKNN